MKKHNEHYQKNIHTQNPLMRQVFRIIEKVARNQWLTVQIRGETGTEKELIARAIHDSTHQNDKAPFVKANCIAAPEKILESELFGYEKGAFAESQNGKPGLLEASNGGTLFLSEIGEISLPLQAKFLKVIEQKRFRRMGSITETLLRNRVIASTNADLEKKVKDGSFRYDLYKRLKAIEIQIPPLRDRYEDILSIAKHFLVECSQGHYLHNRTFSPDVEAFFMMYDWPGNARELRNVVEKALVFSDNNIISLDEIYEAIAARKQNGEKVNPLTVSSTGKNGIPENGMTFKENEIQLICETLFMTKGNKAKASKILGISRPRLYRKIEEYGIKF